MRSRAFFDSFGPGDFSLARSNDALFRDGFWQSPRRPSYITRERGYHRLPAIPRTNRSIAHALLQHVYPRSRDQPVTTTLSESRVDRWIKRSVSSKSLSAARCAARICGWVSLVRNSCSMRAASCVILTRLADSIQLVVQHAPWQGALSVRGCDGMRNINLFGHRDTFVTPFLGSSANRDQALSKASSIWGTVWPVRSFATSPASRASTSLW